MPYVCHFFLLGLWNYGTTYCFLFSTRWECSSKSGTTKLVLTSMSFQFFAYCAYDSGLIPLAILAINTNCDQYTDMDVTWFCQIAIECGIQDQTETTYFHWLAAANWHSEVIRKQECEYANWEGPIVSWALQSGWMVRIRQENDIN